MIVYFILTTYLAEYLVNNKLYAKITDYINGDIQINDLIVDENLMKRFINDLKQITCTDERVLHISSVAVNKNNLPVLNLIRNQIKVAYDRNDGNVCTLLHIAIDNMIENPRTGRRKNRKYNSTMLRLLCDIAKENNEDITEELYFQSTCLFQTKNFKLIDFFVSQNISLFNLYYYSIAWDHPKITKYLIDKYKSKINDDWTNWALEEAKMRNSQGSLELFKMHTYKPKFQKHDRQGPKGRKTLSGKVKKSKK